MPEPPSASRTAPNPPGISPKAPSPAGTPKQRRNSASGGVVATTAAASSMRNLLVRPCLRAICHRRNRRCPYLTGSVRSDKTKERLRAGAMPPIIRP